MIRLQVGAEEVKEFVQKEAEKLRESAEKVRRWRRRSIGPSREPRSFSFFFFLLLSSLSLASPRTKKKHIKAEADALAERRLTEADQGFDAALVRNGRERKRESFSFFSFRFFFSSVVSSLSLSKPTLLFFPSFPLQPTGRHQPHGRRARRGARRLPRGPGGRQGVGEGLRASDGQGALVGDVLPKLV